MGKTDDLDKRYLSYNPDEDYNGSIGMGIMDEVISKYGSIEAYQNHLNEIDVENSKLIKKTNSARDEHLNNMFSRVNKNISQNN